MFLSIFIVIALSLNSALGNDGSFTPVQYRDFIEQGFSTNYFKSCNPMKKYRPQNIQDILNKGFKNLRLRSSADLIEGMRGFQRCSIPMKRFLEDLTTVVDRCLEVGIVPIISWIHFKDEANATETARKNYVKWWTEVAIQLRERDYRLSFNLFTELGIELAECDDKATCGQNSLRKNKTKYNQWTRDVIAAIRATGGNNKKRILILGSPGKTAKDLYQIDQDILEKDHLLVEWHLYASGPINVDKKSQKYWIGDGRGPGNGRENVKEAIKYATDFTQNTGIYTYLGAWMPADNINGSLTQYEVMEFAKYFVRKLHKENIPWSLNVLDRYYDTEQSTWIEVIQEIQNQPLNMAEVLDVIIDNMK